jgi:hypothetical protein
VPLADSCSAANWHSFDQLVGAAGQGQRDGDAKRLGRLEVDVQLDLRDLLHWQISGLLALENAPGIDAGHVGYDGTLLALNPATLQNSVPLGKCV